MYHFLSSFIILLYKDDYKSSHYENTPIQINWKFYLQKSENFHIKISDIFIYLLKTKIVGTR